MVCYFGVIVIHVQHLRMVYFNYWKKRMA
jgi:hypothetical protein